MFGLLNPSRCSAASLASRCSTMHGGAYLGAEGGATCRRPRAAISRRSAALVLSRCSRSAASGSRFLIDGYAITERRRARRSVQSAAQDMWPAAPAQWLANYGPHPWTLAAPVLGFVGAVLPLVLFRARESVCVLRSSPAR